MVVAAGASYDVVSGLSGQSNLHKYASVAFGTLRRHQSFSQGVEHEVVLSLQATENKVFDVPKLKKERRLFGKAASDCQ
jgi:hypothetical protein